MTIDKLTNTIAAASVVSPWWLPSLNDVSQTAAALLPIAGLLWILFQFYWRISGRDKN